MIRIKMIRRIIYVSIATLLLTAISSLINHAKAGTCLIDNVTVNNCITVNGANGEKPNVLLEFVHATERADNTRLSLSEIAGVRAYFVDPNNRWTNFTTPDNTDTKIYIYKEPNIYDVMLTTFDTNGLESDPSVIVNVDTNIIVEIIKPKEPSGINVRVIVTFGG